MITLDSLKYGVELECCAQTRETVAHAVQSVVGGTVRYIGGAPYDPWCVTAPDGREWRVVADSSLSAYPQELRAEVVTPILTWDDLTTVQEIVRALRRAKCVVNGQAGLHVHVGAELFTGKTLAILAKQVYANEELIFHAFAVSEERKARYTKPLDPAFITRLERTRPSTRDAFFRCWYGTKHYTPTRYHHSRYAIVNFNSTALRDTIEFRSYSPEGLHAAKIKAAIIFSLALCARALNSRAASAKKKTTIPGVRNMISASRLSWPSSSRALSISTRAAISSLACPAMRHSNTRSNVQNGRRWRKSKWLQGPEPKCSGPPAEWHGGSKRCASSIPPGRSSTISTWRTMASTMVPRWRSCWQ